MALLPTSVPANFSTTVIYGDQNHTNHVCSEGESEEWIYTVIPVYILLITVLGIIFNVFVLMVFCLHKKACTVAEIYLSNLAAADLVLMVCLPFWAVNASKRFNWPFGLFLCKVNNLCIKMNAYCSIYFLVLVSLDRYVAVVHTMSLERIRRSKYAKLGCVLVWGLGLLLSVPTFIYRELKHNSQSHALCYINTTNTEYLLTEGILTVFSFIIPISIISYCTVKIIQALNNRFLERVNSQKMEHKATTLVLAVLLAFLICWVPFHLGRIVELLVRAEVLGGCSLINGIKICNQIFTYLAFFNSVLNPILYVIVGKNFRNKVWEVFKQWSIKRTATLNITSMRSTLSRSLKFENTSRQSASL
ncbi:B2 bradykinin receptor-like [Siniperca chuatsi]|uniref:B2 bradykinin receptor-like n=1 Tax=Siniperca chuatsi TaxID=119488 RepID=UPI001CE06464|nr:B2 bradykinin receptor-like [Siniperca chuatsi]